MNKSYIIKDRFMLEKDLGKNGYDLWNHIFVGKSENTGKEKTFYVLFIAINPDIEKEKVIVLNKHNEADIQKDIKPSYLLVKAGCIGKEDYQFNRYFAWKDIKIDYDEKEGFNINALDCLCTEKKLVGSIDITPEFNSKHLEYMSDIGKIEWNLNINKLITSNIEDNLISILGKEIGYHAEGLKTEYDGCITLNGEKYNVIADESIGFSEKRWGKKLVKPIISLTSNKVSSNLTNEKLVNVAFNVIIDDKKRLLTDVYYAGRNLEFISNKINEKNLSLKEDDKYIVWNIRQESKKFIVEIKICAQKEDVSIMTFEEPNGKLNDILNTANGFGEVDIYRKEKNKEIIIDSLEVRNAFCRYENEKIR